MLIELISFVTLRYTVLLERIM